MTTNGVLLAAHAAGLKTAGLTRINVILDSMRRETFAQITGADRLDQVLEGIHCALNEGLNPVKINVVLLEGINEPDVPSFARLTIDNPIDVRFIERMPFGSEELPHSPDPFQRAQGPGNDTQRGWRA